MSDAGAATEDPLSGLDAALATRRVHGALPYQLIAAATPDFVRENVDRLHGYVALLDELGYRTDADRLLAAMRHATGPGSEEAVKLDNRQALLAAARGDHGRALTLLQDAHIDAGRAGSPMLATIVANLAAVNLLAGNLADARKWAQLTADGRPGLLTAAVSTAVAKLTADSNAFHEAAAEQHRRTADYLRHAAPDDPVALGAFAAAAATGSEAGQGDEVLDALEIALQRNAATLGARHPQTVVALINLASARFRAARDQGTPDDVGVALAELRSATERAAAVFGADSHRTLVAWSNLASAEFELARAHRSPERARQALPALRSVADRTADVLGADHPEALLALSNLATAEFEMARLEGSSESVARALDTLATASSRSAAVLGASHPATVVLDQELRLCAELFEEDEGQGGLAVMTKVRTKSVPPFGDDYVPFGEVQQLLDNPGLSTVHFPPPSVEQFFQDLADVDRMVQNSEPLPSEDHSRSLTSRSLLLRRVALAPDPHAFLAALRRRASMTALSRTRYIAELLQIPFGKVDQHTMMLFKDIAEWRGHAGDPTGAWHNMDWLVSGMKFWFGEEHPATLAARVDLAHWDGEVGRRNEALAGLSRVLTLQDEEHDQVTTEMLVTRNNYAHWLGRQRGPKAAVGALRRVINQLTEVLGPHHVYTLAARNNHACWRGEAGHPVAAANELRRLHTTMVDVLGPAHPDTLATRNNLAYWLGRSGDPASAVAELGRLLDHQIRLLGRAHPEVATTLANIRGWQERAES
ncbi:tetratricopeptide repeat protein [Actinosynnema sp. CS-041913]|uniref:tetratricopeptide repeat protein n=1 Tax=Actinosynnema sp. CS-041913 TaxID=3239917 RepID=UPI003D8DCC0F